MLFAVQLLHLALVAGAVAGCAMLVAAGVQERRGRLEEARARGRRGGFLVAGCTATMVATGVVWLSLLPAPARERLLGSSGSATVLLTLAAGVTVLAGFVGLLAGLSGKPRPGGWFAAALLLAGLGATAVLTAR